MVGDRVWVNGVRPGYIQYIGETSFAHGEWAGVVLDSPTGKNDGSFGGKRYFYCEPNRGIFCRLWRLTRYPLVTSKFEDRYSPILRSSSVDRKNNKLVTTTTFSRAGSPTRSLSSTSSRDSLGRPKKTVTVTTTTTSLDGYPLTNSGSLRVGDRVYVSTSKGLLSGRLRFMGHADFATGYWAGVELDEPLGKNDGSVGGRRYVTSLSISSPLSCLALHLDTRVLVFVEFGRPNYR